MHRGILRRPRVSRVGVWLFCLIIGGVLSEVRDPDIASFCFFGDSGPARDWYGSGDRDLLYFYQRYISPAKGGNTCPMYPSCSQYAKIAVEKDGPIVAFAATCDRLARCGRDCSAYSIIATAEGPRMYDPVSPVGAQQSIPVLGPTKTADSTESKHECSPFARQLLNEKKWTLAMLEFERTLHLSGDPCCRIEAAEGLFECSYHIDEFAPFLDNFYRVLDTLRDDTIGKTRCGVLLAKRYILSGDYTGAIAALRRYACTGDERYVLISFCFLSLRDPKQAGRFADSISAGSPFRKFTDSVRLRSAAIVVPAYSPGIAGVLSAIIPGAGYLYINRPQTAIASFFINGLFVWSTVDFISARQYGAGATSLLLGSGFYFGNIRGSVVAARNENDKTRKLKIGILLEHSGYFW